MAEILLDKSWIQGASHEILAAVASEHDLLMSGTLLYELLTTSKGKQIVCFSRLSAVQLSVRLLCETGDLLRYEAQAGGPAIPLINRCIGRSISFHPDASVSGYPFSREQIELIEAERVEREVNRPQELKRMYAGVSGWFPALKGLRAGSSREKIKPFLDLVASDADMVRSIYAAIRQPDMPPPDVLDDRWAFFRLMQVRLVGALEYIRRYGDGNESATGRKIPNFFLDQEYLIPGLLADGIATCDNELLSYHELLAPLKKRFKCGRDVVQPAGAG